MKAFAALLDRLSYESRRNTKIRLLISYFAEAPDPERGWALAALTGELSFDAAKASLIRNVAAARVDETLLAMSYDYVGDLAETVALIWPEQPACDEAPPLTDIVHTLNSTGRAGLPSVLTTWLDRMTAVERWALLKLITGGLRVGVSARLTKQALAQYGNAQIEEIEKIWPGLEPPYTDFFAWLDGTGKKPAPPRHGGFHPVMLANPLEDNDLEKLDPADYSAEWKWDGIRVQAVAGGGVRKLYSRTGEDISAAFPDLLERMDFDAAIDGELLVIRDGEIGTFNELQKRLNRKTISHKLQASHPVGIVAYDLIKQGAEDLTALPFAGRRVRLDDWISTLDPDRFQPSPLLDFDHWDLLAARRAQPPHPAIEGVMLKRWDAPYVPGRPKGPWFKWKRDPFLIDCVLMYAQRGHGKRSSFYSDYTFGVWQTSKEGETLVPVGKAYFGFTDDELAEIDKFVRNHTTKRFGPVREVSHTQEEGLVLEIAFEGLQRSPRHKSGVAMRFPRIHRLRWDKPPREADRIEALEQMLGPETAPEMPRLL